MGVVSLPFAMDLARHTLHLSFIRYTFIASPAIFALFAAGFSNWTGPWKHLVPAAWTACCLAIAPLAIRYAVNDNPDWKPFGTRVRGEVPAGETIVFTSEGASGYWFYLFVSHYGSLSDHPIVIMTKPPRPELLTTLRAAGNLWVVCPPIGPPLGAFPGGAVVRVDDSPVAMLGRVESGHCAAAPGASG